MFVMSGAHAVFPNLGPPKLVPLFLLQISENMVWFRLVNDESRAAAGFPGSWSGGQIAQIRHNRPYRASVGGSPNAAESGRDLALRSRDSVLAHD
jgi:hypothetical protein